MYKRSGGTTDIEVVNHIDYIVVEPKVNPKKKIKTSMYKESKIARHTTVGGKGIVGRIYNKKGKKL